MLENVHIKNLALIDEANIDYENGLNIMTGETGSGKSIIISSVNMALGEKANKGMIRRDCDFGLVELTFRSELPAVHELLKTLEIEDTGNIITVTRKITKDSSVSKINGETVTLANLKKLTSMLVDIHGQHDHQSLLDQANHIKILDQFGSDEISGVKADFRKKYDEYRSLKNQFRQFDTDKASIEQKISFLEFEHNEIDSASLLPGEDDKLRIELKALEAFAKGSDALKGVLKALGDEDEGAVSKIASAAAHISSAAASDPDSTDIKAFASAISDLDSIADDLCRDLEKYISDHEPDRERTDTVRKRLALIDKLESKYGRTVSDVLEYDEKTLDELNKWKDYLKNRDEITARLTALRSELNHEAARLSSARHDVSSRLEKVISENLEELNFLNVDFRIEINKTELISDKGFDRVEFLISLNPGENVKPLVSVASGGELSRIMLAIKTSIADNDSIPTLIFDEIDTGISGRTAQMVGVKLRSLSRGHQIISITHLPQIAAMADTHFSIRKEVEDGVTISGIEKLDKDHRVIEIARLLSGEEITGASMENARVLLEEKADI